MRYTLTFPMKQSFLTWCTCCLLGAGLYGTAGAQNIGIGTSSPAQKLHIEVDASADGLRIDNIAQNGDPILQYRINGDAKFTFGVDDSDEDKFKIGTTSISSSTIITLEKDREIGIRTSEPAHMLHMVSGGGSVGANSMAAFENQDQKGVALGAYDKNRLNEFNAFEGVTYYEEGTATPAGVYGLAVAEQTVNNVATIGVVGHTNLWQGMGVIGSRSPNNGPDTGFGGQFYDDVGYTGGLFNISDRRTKKNIRSVVNAVALVKQLRPVSYEFDLEQYPRMGLPAGREFGFVAQEVQQVLPDVTATKTFMTDAGAIRMPHASPHPHTEDFVVMDYSRLIPILTQAIKEQQETIERLEREVESLKEKVDESAGGN